MKVLIVVDLQNDFVTGSLGTKEAQKIIPNIVNKLQNINKIEYEDYNIWFTLDTHYADYLRTLEGKNLPVKLCLKYTSGWGLVDDVYDFVDDRRVIQKSTFGYSWGNTLADREYQIASIEICGLCTDICVISNALILRSKYPNTEIIVDASCCAGTTPEKHKAALEVMKSCQIEVVGE